MVNSAEQRSLLVEANQYETASLLSEWEWLVPNDATPIYLSAMGDWVFGQSNGSLWFLSVLDGAYYQVADNAKTFNELNKSEEWINETFLADWLQIALIKGLTPNLNECLGWKTHPILGGKFEVNNLQIFSMLVYQSIMGQLFRQIHSKQTQVELNEMKQA
jgi:Domain of unknown function (DUF1851)